MWFHSKSPYFTILLLFFSSLATQVHAEEEEEIEDPFGFETKEKEKPLPKINKGSLSHFYTRMVKDINAGRPIVFTVHIALCYGEKQSCGKVPAWGVENNPSKNLYWNTRSGFYHYFKRKRGYREVYSDAGDGHFTLRRAVFKRRISKPPLSLRKMGARKGFDVYVVGIAYRGIQPYHPNREFLLDLNKAYGDTIKISNGRTIKTGGEGHMVGYIGANYLSGKKEKDLWQLVKKKTRTKPITYFALTPQGADTFAEKLCSPLITSLFLPKNTLHPGAFVAQGLFQGIIHGENLKRVFHRAVRNYAENQKRPIEVLNNVFLHQEGSLFASKYPACTSIR